RGVVAVLEFGSPEPTALEDELLDLMIDIGRMLGRVADRERAAQMLRDSEQRTRRVIETAGDAFVSVDADGRNTGWNKQAETTFGWSADEAIGRPLDELFIPPSYRAAHRRGLEHFLATGRGPALGQRLELTALDRSAREFPIELKVWAIQEGSSWSFN